MYVFQINTDNLPYEKVGKNDPVCIADEVPFDVPDTWEWVRLGSIGDWGSGATPSRSIPEYYGGDIPWLKTGDLNDGYIEYIPENISRLALEKTSVRLNPTGSVLIAMYREQCSAKNRLRQFHQILLHAHNVPHPQNSYMRRQYVRYGSLRGSSAHFCA